MKNNFIQRLAGGWTFTRIFYLLIGVVLLVQALYDRDWTIAVFGIYCSAMGIFAIGCAAGNCTVNQSPIDTLKSAQNNLEKLD